MLYRAIIEVRGRVQGVEYRFFALETARNLPEITGFVRNAWESRLVEAEAEGEREVLERFVVLLRSGPPLGRVEDLSVRWEHIEERRYHGFEIEG